MKPPASSILFCSDGLEGLWSKDKGIAVCTLSMTLASTHLESPTLAQKSLVRVTITTQAVHPQNH